MQSAPTVIRPLLQLYDKARRWRTACFYVESNRVRIERGGGLGVKWPPKRVSPLTEQEAEDVERHEKLLPAVVNAVVVAERGGSSVPCLLGHRFLIRVRLHLRSPTVTAPKVAPHLSRALLCLAVSQFFLPQHKNKQITQRARQPGRQAGREGG